MEINIVMLKNKMFMQTTQIFELFGIFDKKFFVFCLLLIFTGNPFDRPKFNKLDRKLNELNDNL